MGLETFQIVRSAPLALREPHDATESHGTVRIDRGPVVETWTNTPAGTEQAWHFENKPRGTGGLVVRVAVGGMSFLGAASDGLIFKIGGAARLHYGAATFVDARGVRTPATETWTDGHIVLRVPAGAVEDAAYPAVLDPVVSAEYDVDSPVHVPWSGPYSGYNGSRPAVAWGGSSYLAVWDQHGLRGARIGLDGSVLDKPAFSITTKYGVAAPVTIAPTGSGYCVIGASGGLEASAVSSNGSSVAGAVIPAPGYPQVAAASNGLTCLAVWTSQTGASGSASLRASDAQLVATAPLPTASTTVSAPAVASDGQAYLAVWLDGGDIQAARATTPAQSVSFSAPFTVASAVGSASRPRVAWDGAEYLMVWDAPSAAGDGGADSDIYGARVASDGTLLDTQPLIIAAAAGDQTAPDVSPGPTGGFRVAWDDARSGSGTQLYAARVADDGTVLDPGGHALSPTLTDEGAPALASSGLGSIVVWPHDASGNPGVYGARLDSAGQALAPAGFPVALQPNEQTEPFTASDGSGYFVVWTDRRNDDADVYGMRVDSSGQPLDPQAIQIAGGPDRQIATGIAWNGKEYLVVWQHETFPPEPDGLGVYATPVNSNAQVGTSFAVGSTEATSGTVTALGQQFVIAWSEPYNTTKAEILDSHWNGTPLSIAGPFTSGVRLAANSTEVLAVGPGAFSGSPPILLGKLVDASGHYVGEFQIPGNPQAFDVLWDGTDFVVTWSQSLTNAISTLAVRVGSDGVVDTSSQTAVGPAAPWLETGWDGQSTVVLLLTGALVGTRLSPSLAPLDSGFWDVTSSVTPVGWLNTNGMSEASDGQRHTLVAYSSQAPGLPQGFGIRVHTRLITTQGLLGATCTSDAECESGHCADGVCCNVACGGSVTTDCEACSVAAGGPKDGTCGIVASGVECRAVAGTCDVAESCDGVHTSCPADAVVAAGTACRPSAGECDIAEQCDGTSGACPADLYQPDGTACSAGACGGGACLPPGTDAGSDAAADGGPTGDAAVDGASSDAASMDAADAGPTHDAATDGTIDAATDAPAKPGPVDFGGSGSCGCRTAGERPGAPWPDLVLLGLLIGLVRRRRSSQG